MKNFMKGLLIVAAALIVIPLLPAFLSAKSKDAPLPGPDAAEASATIAKPEADIKSDIKYMYIDTVHIYDVESGKTVDLSLEEYLYAAVLGAVSPTAEPELLKAQTVLMYTYILGKRQRAVSSPDLEINGCDISTDSQKYVRLVLKDEADGLYKDKLPDYEDKLKAAITACKGEYVAYDGKPIVPAYCFSCGGTTESAEDVLGEKVPYLVQIDSEYDSGYTTEAVYTKDEIFARLALSDEAVTLLGPCEDWIAISESSETGYIKSLMLDGKYSMSGATFARLLNLPSARFTFRYSKEFESYTFKVSGAGHLVGLSQYGANEMAKRGADYKEILLKYFVGTEIKRTDDIS